MKSTRQDRPSGQLRATRGSGLHGLWKRYGGWLFTSAMEANIQVMASVLAEERHRRGRLRILDLGCWDGETTMRYVPGDADVAGVEQDRSAAVSALRSGIREAMVADLNGPLPLEDCCFDVVTSNQVFEHLHDTDTFLSEAYRVLRPGGLLVVSTENLASWHNIAALTFGWQAFSLTNVTNSAAGVGNPLANLRHEEPLGDGWQHQRIFAYRGLRDVVRLKGFDEPTIRGAGYYPLPRQFAKVDPRHAAFITVIARRPGVEGTVTVNRAKEDARAAG